MASLFKNLIREDRGNAFIETSIMLPVLVTLGFGALDFASVFFQHQEMTTGLRDAARYLARVPASPAAPSNGNDCVTAIAANAGTATNLAVYGGGAQPRVPGWLPGNVNVTTTTVGNAGCPRPYNGPDPLCIVTVSTSAPYTGFGFLAAIGVPLPTINLSHSERWMGLTGAPLCS